MDFKCHWKYKLTKKNRAYVIIYDIRAKVGLFYLESSSYQFLKFDFTFGFSKRIAHTCVLRPIERSYVPRKIETCKLPLIAIKRFPNSNIRLFKYNIYIYIYIYIIHTSVWRFLSSFIQRMKQTYFSTLDKLGMNYVSIHQIIINAMIISYMNNLTDISSPNI